MSHPLQSFASPDDVVIHQRSNGHISKPIAMFVMNGEKKADENHKKSDRFEGKAGAMAAAAKLQFPLIVTVIQVAFFVLFGLFADYDTASKPGVDDDLSHFSPRYSMFQDTHVMIFIGFGFLMTFLKRYGFSAVSINLLLACITIEWGLIVRGFFSEEFKDHGKFVIGTEQ